MPGKVEAIVAYRKARAALVAAINKEFPVGTRVMAKWGRGWMYGEVAFETTALSPEDVAIRSQLGRVHRKHYSEVQHDENP